MLCLLPVFIEFSRFCGTYQSAKFEYINFIECMKENDKYYYTLEILLVWTSSWRSISTK